MLWNPKKFPTSETDKIDFKHPYALTKYLGEKFVIEYASMFKMPNISFRFFNVYGPRLNSTGQYGAVFGNFLKQKNNKPLTIVGDGKQTRDFIHVDDLIYAFLKMIKTPLANKIYNLGSGKETQLIKSPAYLVEKEFLFQRDQVNQKDPVRILIRLKVI